MQPLCNAGIAVSCYAQPNNANCISVRSGFRLSTWLNGEPLFGLARGWIHCNPFRYKLMQKWHNPTARNPKVVSTNQIGVIMRRY